MNSTVELLKALGDENRFRITMLLKKRSMCVCEIFEILNISGATLSAHLKALVNAGVISRQRDGRWIQYSLYDDAKILKLLDTIESSLANKEMVKNDREKASKINREQCAAAYSGKE